MSVFPRIAKIALLILVFMVSAGISTYLTVHLLIRSEDTVVVPDLIGKEVVYALEMLTDLGLDTKVKGSEFSVAVPRHHIVSQDPAAGTEIKKGRDVRLVLSKGARSVVLPNLSGLSAPQARILLEENGLRHGQQSYMFDPIQPPEQVLSQSPAAGTIGQRDNQVDLLISAGPPPQWTYMTSLIGTGFNEAVQIIEQQHLALGTVDYVYNASQPEGIVVDQTPGGGFSVLPGSVVNLSVNRLQRRAASGGESEADLFRYRVPNGFLRQSVRVRIHRPTASLDIYEEFVKPGREIWLLVPKAPKTTLFLYVDDELVTTKYYH